MPPIPIPTRTLRNYFASLPNGGGAGVVDQQLVIRNDIGTGTVNGVAIATANGLAGTSDGMPSTPTLTLRTTLGSGEIPVSNGTGFAAGPVTGAGNIVLATSPTLVTPALGTPSALVGTNITGTAAGLTSGITNGLKSATTTVSVSAATAPSVGQVLTATGPTAATWQTPTSGGASVNSQASAASITPDTDTYSMYALTAQAANLTINAPTGTPTNGKPLTIRIRDNGTTRTLTWNAAYVQFATGQLPATTVINKTHYFIFWWNSTTSVWELVGGNPVAGLWGA